QPAGGRPHSRPAGRTGGGEAGREGRGRDSGEGGGGSRPGPAGGEGRGDGDRRAGAAAGAGRGRHRHPEGEGPPEPGRRGRKGPAGVVLRVGRRDRGGGVAVV